MAYNTIEYDDLFYPSTQGRTHAWVQLYAGEEKLFDSEESPNALLSFEIDRMSGSGEKATLSIFDDYYDYAEALLAKNYSDLVVIYGFTGSESVSPAYHMMLQDYSIEFNGTGTILNINAISTAVGANLDTKMQSIDPTYNPAVAIKSICKMMGWSVKDENFEEFDTSSSEDPDNPLDKEDYYNTLGKHPITFINDTLIPEMSVYGDTWEFYIDGNLECYLRKSEYNEKVEHMRTYVYRRGYNSTVLDMSFDIKGVFGGTTNGFTVTPALPIMTGGSGRVYSARDKSVSTIYNNITYEDALEMSKVTGENTHTKLNQSIGIIDSAGDSELQRNSKVLYQLKTAADSQYEATVTIIGDPTINFLESVNLLNLKDNGVVHHTSGIYMIKGIVDSISDGNYITTLKLQRNGDIDNAIQKIPKHKGNLHSGYTRYPTRATEEIM